MNSEQENNIQISQENIVQNNKEEKSFGPLIGIIIIVAIIIIGGLYFWGEKISKNLKKENFNQEKINYIENETLLIQNRDKKFNRNF